MYSCSAHADDCVIISEQTLDQQSFIVVNERTGERGRVPVDYIRIGKDTKEEREGERKRERGERERERERERSRESL